jgi:hypothetical protein
MPQFFATKPVEHLLGRPTMRWVFQCFEGIELLHIRHGPTQATISLILRLTPLRQQILALLGPTYEQCYESRH